MACPQPPLLQLHAVPCKHTSQAELNKVKIDPHDDASYIKIKQKKVFSVGICQCIYMRTDR